MHSFSSLTGALTELPDWEGWLLQFGRHIVAAKLGVEENHWNGRAALQLQVKDIRRHEA